MAVTMAKPVTVRKENDLTDDVEHPIGTGTGAGVGAIVGASIGTVGGPIGMAVGATAGAVIGAVSGEAITESLDFTDEDDKYWRQTHSTRPYVVTTDTYETYRPAYRYGAEAHGRNAGRPYDEVRNDLRSDWEGTSSEVMGWDKAEPAVRDAYQRRYDTFGHNRKAS